MKTLMISGVFFAMAAMARADAPLPSKDDVVLTLTAKPPLSIDGRLPVATGGLVFLELSRPAPSTGFVDAGSKTYSGLAAPSSLSIARTSASSTELRFSQGQKAVYKVEDEPGPGYRRIIEWYENMKRPLPKLGQ